LHFVILAFGGVSSPASGVRHPHFGGTFYRASLKRGAIHEFIQVLQEDFPPSSILVPPSF